MTQSTEIKLYKNYIVQKLNLQKTAQSRQFTEHFCKLGFSLVFIPGLPALKMWAKEKMFFLNECFNFFYAFGRININYHKLIKMSDYFCK